MGSIEGVFLLIFQIFHNSFSTKHLRVTIVKNEFLCDILDLRKFVRGHLLMSSHLTLQKMTPFPPAT